MTGPFTTPPYRPQFPNPAASRGGKAHPAAPWPEAPQFDYRAAAPPFAEAAYPWPDEPQDRRTRIWRRLLNLLAILIIGAGAAFAGAWWATNPFPQDATPTVADSKADPAAEAPMEPTSALPPLAFEELPYDGVALAGDAPLVPRLPYALESPEEGASSGGSDDMQTQAGAAGKRRDPAAKTSDSGAVSAESTKTTPSSAASPEKSAAADEPTKRASSSQPKPEAKSATALASAKAGSSDKDGSSAKASDASAEQDAGRRPVARDEGKGESARKPTAVARAKSGTASTGRTTGRVARQDGEISRIQQQAADELRRRAMREGGFERWQSLAEPPRTEGSSGVATTAGAAQSAAGPSTAISTSGSRHPAVLTRARLAQCGAAPSLFARERCRWRVCGGRWGEDGCPSYPAQNNPAAYR